MMRAVILIAAVQFFIPVPNRSNAQTWADTRSQADWGGRDRTCSIGSTPDPKQCDRVHIGQIAVCWSNCRSGECHNAAAWCTYKDKTVGFSTAQNGYNPGEVYGCGLGTIINEISICHGENQKRIINFNPFSDPHPHGCDDHAGYNVFEGCAGGGANPAVSGANLCNGGTWTARSNYPPVNGDRCGYSWFTVSCWSGP